MGIFGPRFCLSYLPLAKQAAFRCRVSLVAPERSLCRSNARLHHIGSVVAGIQILGSGNALPLSYSKFRLLVGIEPTTEVTRAFTTPQTYAAKTPFGSRCTSDRRCVRTHTHTFRIETHGCSPNH